MEKRKSKETKLKETSRECAHTTTYMVGTAYLKEGVSIIKGIFVILIYNEYFSVYLTDATFFMSTKMTFSKDVI